MNDTEKTIKRNIGARVRNARIMRGLTQTQLAKQLGITFQQAQKYENGTNNINATRLLSIAGILGVSIHYLYGVPDAIEGEALPRRKFLHLIKALQSIENHPAIFDSLYNLAVTLAKKCE